MRRSLYWVLVIFAGSLPLGYALQYYFAGEPDLNSSTRNWLIVGQAFFGLVIMGFGLYKQIQTERRPMAKTEEPGLSLNDD